MNILVNTKNIISISEARSRMMSISSKNRTPFLITKNGKPDFYLLPQEDLSSWLETHEILKESTNIISEINEARLNSKMKENISLSIAIKNRNKYVQSRAVKKGK